jgi:hypothetical protein
MPSELSGDHALKNNIGKSPEYFPSKEVSNAELDSTPRHELHSRNKFGVCEAPGDHKVAEVDGGEKPTELPGEDRIFELDAAQEVKNKVPEIYLEPATAVEPDEGSMVLPSPREELVRPRWEEVAAGKGDEKRNWKEKKEDEQEKRADRRRQSW